MPSLTGWESGKKKGNREDSLPIRKKETQGDIRTGYPFLSGKVLLSCVLPVLPDADKGHFRLTKRPVGHKIEEKKLTKDLLRQGKEGTDDKGGTKGAQGGGNERDAEKEKSPGRLAWLIL